MINLNISNVINRLKICGIEEINENLLISIKDLLISKLCEECNRADFPAIAKFSIEKMLIYNYVLEILNQKEFDALDAKSSPKSITIENTRIDFEESSSLERFKNQLLRKYENEFLSFIHCYRCLKW